jgi:hypothetical protein
MWIPTEHSDEENLRWCWLRAVEWGSWPVFISQPIAPLALLFFPWWAVILATIGANAIWTLFVRYKVVDPALAFFGAIVVRFKWITCPVAAYALWHRDMRAVAMMALLWPLLILVMPGWPAQIGVIQEMFMGCLGYQRTGRS